MDRWVEMAAAAAALLAAAVFLGWLGWRRRRAGRGPARGDLPLTCDVKRPRDPRARACLESVGCPMEILHRGRRKTILPLEVFTRPDRRQTYVRARVDDAIADLSVDDIELTR
jgi:hypothetical protein